MHSFDLLHFFHFVQFVHALLILEICSTYCTEKQSGRIITFPLRNWWGPILRPQGLPLHPHHWGTVAAAAAPGFPLVLLKMSAEVVGCGEEAISSDKAEASLDSLPSCALACH
jgi:hypothetical protein